MGHRVSGEDAVQGEGRSKALTEASIIQETGNTFSIWELGTEEGYAAPACLDVMVSSCAWKPDPLKQAITFKVKMRSASGAMSSLADRR